MIDIKLIEECRGGNLNNFRKLVESTSPGAFTVAFRMLGDEDEAKDVVQETMITIWKKLSKIKSAEVYKTWTYRIVVNKCYDNLEKERKAMSSLQMVKHGNLSLILYQKKVFPQPLRMMKLQ